MTATAETPRTPEVQRQRQVDQDIALLKEIRITTLDLRVKCDGYSRQLSYEFMEPLHKTESALMALLLERELRQSTDPDGIDPTYEAFMADHP